jgi:penicillin-binding protein 2
VTPIQLLRALSGLASDGHFVRPRVVDLSHQRFPVPADFRQAVLDGFPGSGDRTVPLNPDTWMTITDGMAAATTPGLYHTAEAAHLDGVDFAGKTGTAQVVGGGDTHVKGGEKTPNAWFVGMVPRRDPEMAIVVLQEHGDWGSGSAMIAQRIVIAYVNKKRREINNIASVADQLGPSRPVEMGAVWSEPAPARQESLSAQASTVRAGRFFIDPDPPAASRALASGTPALLPAWLSESLLRFKEELPKESRY